MYCNYKFSNRLIHKHINNKKTTLLAVNENSRAKLFGGKSTSIMFLIWVLTDELWAEHNHTSIHTRAQQQVARRDNNERMLILIMVCGFLYVNKLIKEYHCRTGPFFPLRYGVAFRENLRAILKRINIAYVKTQIKTRDVCKISMPLPLPWKHLRIKWTITAYN